MPTTHHCTRCGAGLGDGRFCTRCGQPVDAAPADLDAWRTDTAERPRVEAERSDPVEPPVAATVADLAYLLKQMAMIYFPTQQPAKLTGQSWLAFLDETTHFSGFIEQGQTLVTYAYQPPDQPVDNLATLIDLAESWVTELKKQPPQPWRA